MARRTLAITTLNLPSKGGVFNHIMALIRGLDRSQFQIVVLYWSADPELDLSAEISDPEVTVHRLPALWSKRALFLPAFWTLYRMYRTLRPDVVYSVFSYTDLIAAPAARMAGVRTVVSAIRGRLVAENNPAWERAVFRVLHPVAARAIDRFVAVSAASVAEAGAMLRVDRAKCVVVHNGVTVPNEVPVLPELPILGVISRLQYEKGVDVLLRALPAVRARVPNVRCVVAGEGPDRDALERLTAELGLGEHVQFRGWCRDTRELLAELALVVVPSHREGVPWTLLEAMASGRPVVASAVGGIPEVLVNGETGVLVPPGDADQLSRAIVSILTDPARLRRLGLAGRDRVVRHFSHDATVARMADAFRGVEGAVR